jgi:hypothetical protein
MVAISTKYCLNMNTFLYSVKCDRGTEETFLFCRKGQSGCLLPDTACML